MKRLILAALPLFLLAGYPILAQETEGEKVAQEASTKEEPSNFWAWANFLLLAGGLAYVTKKNAGPYFAQRSIAIRKGMIEADEARAEADAKVADVDRRLANLKTDIEALRRDARQEAEAEAERARRDAANEMEKIKAHLQDEIAAAGKAANLELRRYSAELAIGLAQQKIAARMTPDTQDRLVRIFSDHLDTSDLRIQGN